MTAPLSDFDRLLLDALQDSVPLVPRPWRLLADRLGADEGQVLSRVAALGSGGGIIREIAGVFDAPALGFETTLLAARCDADRLDAAGRVVADHPGVSHCYGRAGELNLWFTLTVAPDSVLGLDGTVDVLARLARTERIVSLPVVRRYKLHVRFDLAAPAGPSPASPPPRPAPHRTKEPSPEQRRAIDALQAPLPALTEPFAELAPTAGMSAEALLVHAADFLAAGWMRRYAALLRHRQAGAAVNVLVAWRVPPERTDRFGAQAAQFRAVSHCYLRHVADRWPWNLYTMIHAADAADAARTVRAIQAAAGDYPRCELPTVTEYKKARVRLFSPAFARWEAEISE